MWELRTLEGGHQVGVSSKLKGAPWGSTLLHELIHAVERTNALELPERTVNVLEAGLAQILQSNPKMTRDLIKALLTPAPVVTTITPPPYED